MAAKVDDKPKTKVKIIKNIRYEGNSYTIGEEIEINEEDLQEFEDAEVIEIKE